VIGKYILGRASTAARWAQGLLDAAVVAPLPHCHWLIPTFCLWTLCVLGDGYLVRGLRQGAAERSLSLTICHGACIK